MSDQATFVKDRISQDIKTAMKSQDKARLGVLRMLLSEIRYLEVAPKSSDSAPDPAQMQLKAVEVYAKKLQKAIDETPDSSLKTGMVAEMVIVKEYLPQKADATATSKVIEQVLASSSERNFGLVMKAVLQQLGGQADNRLVSQLLKEKLG